MITIINKFQAAHEILEKSLYERGVASVCKIHSAFVELEEKHHNCIGCNFAESIDIINKFLRTHELFIGCINERFTIFILHMYLLIERVEVIFKIISLPDEYKAKHFRIFGKIRRWANFLKHPKAFILVHHPLYSFEGDERFDKTLFDVVINQDFVDIYYASDKKNGELDRLLINKDKVAVLYPDPVIITKEFCEAINLFTRIIVHNEVYRELLDERSTFTNYFEKESLENVDK